MTKRPVKNIGASVNARLLALSRERKEDFQLVLTRFALERLLYRLFESDHRGEFVLKGAMVFALWGGEPHRATHDLDLLGFGDDSIPRLGGCSASCVRFASSTTAWSSVPRACGECGFARTRNTAACE